jgi:deoxyribonuclease V
MMACLDVAYHGLEANAAAVLFRSWGDGFGKREIVTKVASAAEYLPGQFYRRELPCLLALLALAEEPLEALIVDGYVWLENGNLPGLGAHLYEALGRSTAVIGVAKSRFAGADGAVPVLRGGSNRPLQITAAGMDVRVAAHHIETMHGKHRIPTLLKRADQLSRSWADIVEAVSPAECSQVPRGKR